MPGEPLPGGMSDIEIEYCVPCGFLNRAVDLAEALLSTFGADVDSVSLVTGDHGVFEVRVDGAVVFDEAEDEADEAAVIRNRIFLVPIGRILTTALDIVRTISSPVPSRPASSICTRAASRSGGHMRRHWKLPGVG